MDTGNFQTTSSAECYNKLEKIKEIRQRTFQIEKMKFSIKDFLQDASEEEKALEEYKTEYGLLQQEKMAHVEELRLIHTDMSTMERLIKQSSSDKNKKLQDAQKMLEQYKSLKRDVDELRQTIGLQKLKDLQEEEPNLITDTLGDLKMNEYRREKMSTSNSDLPLFAPETRDKLQLVGTENKVTTHPPPMKACLSCHQQIHRNAPTCPECKAKSRSRNPKKPKKSVKAEE